MVKDQQQFRFDKELPIAVNQRSHCWLKGFFLLTFGGGVLLPHVVDGWIGNSIELWGNSHEGLMLSQATWVVFGLATLP